MTTPSPTRAVSALEYAAADAQQAITAYAHARMLHHTYPDQLTPALDMERTALLREVRTVQVDVARERLLTMVGAR